MYLIVIYPTSYPEVVMLINFTLRVRQEYLSSYIQLGVGDGGPCKNWILLINRLTGNRNDVRKQTLVSYNSTASTYIRLNHERI